MMIMKGMIGLGIFVLPKLTQNVGWLGFSIFYPIIVLDMVFFLSLVVKVADDIGYSGPSHGVLHVLVLGQKTAWITDLSVCMMSFATALGLISAPSNFFGKSTKIII
jgi:amino acid permease